MKYLNIGDAYIGRDGIVSTYPRGNGLDACCIPARDLLDPSHAKQREIKTYIDESLKAAGRLGLMESKHLLEDNIAAATNAHDLSETITLYKKFNLPVRYDNTNDYAVAVRKNEIEHYLGDIFTRRNMPTRSGEKLPELLNDNRCLTADALFDRAREKVKEHSAVVFDDPTAVAMMRTNDSMRRSHEKDLKEMPSWARKLADDNGVAIMTGGKSLTTDCSFAVPIRQQTCLDTPSKNATTVATYLRGSAITLFSERAFKNKSVGSTTAEETWHLIQDRCFPIPETDPHLHRMALALRDDYGKVFEKHKQTPRLVTPGERLLLEMALDASKQKETGMQEMFANVMQTLTNPKFDESRNDFCRQAPKTTQAMFALVNCIEAEAASPPKKTHQDDFGLRAIPIFGEGRAQQVGRE